MSRVLLGLLVAVGLTACGKKAEEKVPEKAEAVAAPTEQPSIDQMLNAMTRPWERASTVCADGLRSNSFFVLFKTDDYPDHKDIFRGWYLVENVEFYKTSNNTWFITDVPDNKFIKVYPDINGLQCKEANVKTP